MSENFSPELLADMLRSLAAQDKVVVHAKRVVPTGEYGNTNHVEFEAWVTVQVEPEESPLDVLNYHSGVVIEEIEERVAKWRSDVTGYDAAVENRDDPRTRAAHYKDEGGEESYGRAAPPPPRNRGASSEPPPSQETQQAEGDGGPDARGWKPGDILVSDVKGNEIAEWIGFDGNERAEFFPTIRGGPGQYRLRIGGKKGQTSPAAFLSERAEEQLADMLGAESVGKNRKTPLPEGGVRVQWEVQPRGSEYKDKWYWFAQVDSLELLSDPKA